MHHRRFRLERIDELRATVETRWLSTRRTLRLAHAQRQHVLTRRTAAVALCSALALGLLGSLTAVARARANNDHVASSDAASTINDSKDSPLRGEAAAKAIALPPPPPPPTAPPPPTTAPPAPAPPPPAATDGPPLRTAIPWGKGMWIWLPDKADGGDVVAMMNRAKAVGLTHIYVRTGSSWQGFSQAPWLDVLIPAAHDAGLRVYGWDFPNFANVAADIDRAVQAIHYTTPTGHRLDGFSPDIETSSEGVHLSRPNAAAYAIGLRQAVGEDVPLIATVPRPSKTMRQVYPYAELAGPFDAFAPMLYWLNRQPDTDVIDAVEFLRQFGRPLLPVGQAYDGSLEGGRPGPPPPDEIFRFIATSERLGAPGVSFWSWQHANQGVWEAIAAAPQYNLPVGPIVNFKPGQVRAVQLILSSLGYRLNTSGAWDLEAVNALMQFQRDRGHVPTGVIDPVTRGLLLGPLAPRR